MKVSNDFEVLRDYKFTQMFSFRGEKEGLSYLNKEVLSDNWVGFTTSMESFDLKKEDVKSKELINISNNYELKVFYSSKYPDVVFIPSDKIETNKESSVLFREEYKDKLNELFPLT